MIEKENSNKSWPKISIVTPSYNQAQFLEKCINSIISQQYPNLEYIIIDGGSTDGSVDIIKKYEKHLAYWVSEKDKGQYDAINKGFAKSTGEIMAWLNADDMYFPWTLWIVGEIFAKFPQVEWISSIYPTVINKDGYLTKCRKIYGFSKRAFYKGAYLRGGHRSYFQGFIQQESTFWRRSLWEKAGGYVNSALKLAGDFELWARFFQYSELYGVASILGSFRKHGSQKTHTNFQEYFQEAMDVLKIYNYSPYPLWEILFRELILTPFWILIKQKWEKFGKFIEQLFFEKVKLIKWNKKKGWQIYEAIFPSPRFLVIIILENKQR